MDYNFPHVQILGTQHCGKECHESFKYRGSFKNLICRSDYTERVVANFENQIESEYYGGNRSVSIEGIEL